MGRLVVGRPVNVRAPKSCFWAHDLYTTKLGSTYNDDIEKYFFGEIDNLGAKAVKAFAKNDLRAMHELFQRFFEYLDIQKLRTPKGFGLDQEQLSEPDAAYADDGNAEPSPDALHDVVRVCGEIVSAETSDVKFIVYGKVRLNQVPQRTLQEGPALISGGHLRHPSCSFTPVELHCARTCRQDRVSSEHRRRKSEAEGWKCLCYPGQRAGPQKSHSDASRHYCDQVCRFKRCVFD
jgi:hypothetical protein